MKVKDEKRSAASRNKTARTRRVRAKATSSGTGGVPWANWDLDECRSGRTAPVRISRTNDTGRSERYVRAGGFGRQVSSAGFSGRVGVVNSGSHRPHERPHTLSNDRRAGRVTDIRQEFQIDRKATSVPLVRSTFDRRSEKREGN